ncbi:MAG: GFA family protein [Pseudomonadota bacterium]
MTTGRCLCGATSWEFDGAPVWSCYCHCDDCRRNCAAPVVAWLGAPRELFRWTGAAPRTFQSSPGVARHFCADCGTPLGFEADHYPGDMHLYAASLDDPAEFTPEFHVFWTARLPWLPLKDDLPKYPRSLNEAPPELRARHP